MKVLGNKAQVSTEYLIILSILAVLTVIVTAFAFNVLKLKDITKIKNDLYKDSLLKMI